MDQKAASEITNSEAIVLDAMLDHGMNSAGTSVCEAVKHQPDLSQNILDAESTTTAAAIPTCRELTAEIIYRARAANLDEGWRGRTVWSRYCGSIASHHRRHLGLPADHRRHVVLPDLHGTYGALIHNLRDAGVVDSEGNWIRAVTDVVVQMGDVIDRGDESVLTLQRLRRLQEQASRSGGAVIRILGNHEQMLLLGLGGDDLQLFHWVVNLLPYEASACEVSRALHIDLARLRRSPGGANEVFRMMPRLRRTILRADSEDRSAPFGAVGFFFRSLLDDLQEGRLCAAYCMADVLFVHGGVAPFFVAGRSASEVAGDLNARLAKRIDDFAVTEALWNRCGREITGEGIDFLQVVAHTPTNSRVAEVNPLGNVINVDVGQYQSFRGYLTIEGPFFSARQLVRTRPAVN